MSELQQLVAMGFSEGAAKGCLQTCGTVEEAVNALLAQSENNASLQPHQELHQRCNQVVLAPGSQYDMDNGRSACSCICLEAAISILGQLRSGEWSGTTDDVQNILSVGVITYEALIGAGALKAEHTAVDEVMAAVSRYREALDPATPRGCHQNLLGSDASFTRTLQEITSERLRKNSSIAVAITKPPETPLLVEIRSSHDSLVGVGVLATLLLDTDPFMYQNTVVAFLPPDNGTGASSTGSSPPTRQWLLFDSHPRPQLGFTGASVQSFGDESSLAAALAQIFPTVDLEGDGVLASMYNMLDCTPLMLKQTPSV